MSKLKYIQLIISCILYFGSSILSAQTKSTSIITIEGKKYYLHKVEKSQSLYAISKLYNVNLDEIYANNPGLKAGVKAGQEIKIPYTGPAITSVNPGSNLAIVPVDTNKFICYKISKGETVYSLTRKFNLSEKQLVAYNPSLIEGLKEGQTIVVGEKSKRRQSSREQKENKQAGIKENKSVAAAKETRTVTPPAIDSSLLKPVSKPKKAAYTVALILPFKLEQTLSMDLNTLAKNGGHFPAVPALAVDFYLGFKRALDSLTSPDFSVQLNLYDVDEDSLKLLKLVNEPAFKDFDIIFGPLYANGFKNISKKAKELHIPIISPITQQNKILYNNLYISKTNPSQFTLLESLADYCIDSLMNNNANIILVAGNDKDRKELAFVNAFKKYYNEKQRLLGKTQKDTAHVVKGLSGLKGAYVPGVKNVVISLSNNQVFIADFTTQLALFADKKDIVLCGWEASSSNDNIDQEYLNQLNYTFPNQYNLLNTASYAGIIDGYQQLQETYPSDYYFIGFDIAFYYLKNLKSNGPDFVYKLDQLPLEANYTRFKFSRPDPGTGFDNRGVYIFRYNNYQLQKTGWK